MIIYNWLTEEKSPILLNFVDKQLCVKSSYGWNGTMKLITFKKNGTHFTVIIDEKTIVYNQMLKDLCIKRNIENNLKKNMEEKLYKIR